MLEGPWQNQVDELATRYGWELNYHTPAFKPKGKYPPPGFPDNVLCKMSTGRLIFAELKSSDPKSKPTQKQVNWLRGLEAAGAEVGLWRPEDVAEVTLILAGRRRATLPPDFPGYKPLTVTRRRT